MKKRSGSMWKALLIALMLTIVVSGVVLATTITIDGDRESAWANADVGSTGDGNEGSINDNVDIQEVRWTNDDTNFYFLVDVYATVPLMPGLAPVNICLDTDNSSGTFIPSTNTIYRNRCAYASGATGIDTIIEAYRLYNGTLLVDVYDATSDPMTYLGSGTLGYNISATTPVVEVSVSLSTLLGGACPTAMPMVTYYDGGDGNPDDNLPNSGSVTIGCTPTAVELADFGATSTDTGILVSWETASELDNVGFNLYRSDTPDDTYVKLNEALIPSQNPGSVIGGSYKWLDTAVQSGATYYYKLEDVDIDGVSTFHGPVSAEMAAAPTAVQVQRVVAQNALALGALGFVALVGAIGFLRKKYV